MAPSSAYMLWPSRGLPSASSVRFILDKPAMVTKFTLYILFLTVGSVSAVNNTRMPFAKGTPSTMNPDAFGMMENTSVVKVSTSATESSPCTPWSNNCSPESNSMMGLFALLVSESEVMFPFTASAAAMVDLWNHLLYLLQALLSKLSRLMVM